MKYPNRVDAEHEVPQVREQATCVVKKDNMIERRTCLWKELLKDGQRYESLESPERTQVRDSFKEDKRYKISIFVSF